MDGIGKYVAGKIDEILKYSTSTADNNHNSYNNSNTNSNSSADNGYNTFNPGFNNPTIPNNNNSNNFTNFNTSFNNSNNPPLPSTPTSNSLNTSNFLSGNHYASVESWLSELGLKQSYPFICGRHQPTPTTTNSFFDERYILQSI